MNRADDAMRKAIGRLLDLSASLRSEGLPMHANEVMAGADELTAARAAVAELAQRVRDADFAGTLEHHDGGIATIEIPRDHWTRVLAALAAFGSAA